MTKTLEQDLDDGIATAQRITDANDARRDAYRYGSYATEPGCGTKAAILALLPLTAALAAWVGRMA